MSSPKGSSKSDATRLERIYSDTKNYCTLKFTSLKPSKKYNFLYMEEPQTIENYGECVVQVCNIDTFDAAAELSSLGLNCMVLNVCTLKTPAKGSSHISTPIKREKAMEEDIFRVTNYFQTIDPSLFPISDNELIYSPEVYIIRESCEIDGKGVTYSAFLKKPLKISCVTVDIPVKPVITLVNDGYETYNDNIVSDNMEAKIEAIFKLAIVKGHDSLVLGALGCNRNKNPVDEIAEIFQSCISKYRNCFKRIYFAIKTYNEQNAINLDIFSNMLG